MVMACGFIGAGCASQHQPAPVPAGPIPIIGRVDVSLSGTIAADRAARFEKVDGPSRLATAIEAELERKGRFDRDAPGVLDVSVTKYRMRSGASVFMWGLYAGGDLVDVAVALRSGEHVVLGFTTGAGGVGGGFDQVSRFERVAKAVAERVVAELERAAERQPHA